MNQHPRHENSGFRWPSPSGLTLLGFLAIGAFFLLTEHRAHALGALPFVLVALCPLLHLFGHRGHGRRGPPEGKP